MATIKSMIKKIVFKLLFPNSNPTLEQVFIKEAIRFWRLTSRYNASHHTDEDMEKMQYAILRENHVIEKGMSMRNPRKGFGQEKVKNLLEHLERYETLFGKTNKSFLQYPLSTILSYIDYTEKQGVNIDDIKARFSKLEKNVQPIDLSIHAGVKKVTKEEIQSKCNADFESLLYSRHSIRYFSSASPGKSQILKALELAQRTPSACNRQGWKTHVFEGEKSIELMKWQGGCRGFEDELKNSILVTANLKAFLYYEVHQAYIDGGLYAMNLINALHSLGLGCIPLSCGFESWKLQKLKDFGIPENEVPIVIIAFGNLANEFNVAISTRKPIDVTNTFHS